MDISYILNELGEERENYFNAIAPPIVQTSNFQFKKVDEMRQTFKDEFKHYIYSRGINPTVDILRKKMAALDEAEDALVFNSGASAIFCAVLANVKSGDHILSVKDPYSWAQRLFNNILPRFNVSVTYIDGTSITNFEEAIRENTSIIYLESPNSFMFQLQDLRAISQLAKSKNIITIIDNSYCTPLYQKPITLGIDLCLQSATKYIGGHSDVVAGVLTGSHQLINKIFQSEYLNTGSGATPFHAWLLIRGLRSLPARLDRITHSTYQVVEAMKNHSKIERIIFPMDPSFPQYELAKKQMKNACGLFTFILKTDSLEKIEKFCESLHHVMMAVSWGGHESLIIPKCASMEAHEFDAKNPEHRAVRMYVGLESPEYIIADLTQALDKI